MQCLQPQLRPAFLVVVVVGAEVPGAMVVGSDVVGSVVVGAVVVGSKMRTARFHQRHHRGAVSRGLSRVAGCLYFMLIGVFLFLFWRCCVQTGAAVPDGVVEAPERIASHRARQVGVQPTYIALIR